MQLFRKLAPSAQTLLLTISFALIFGSCSIEKRHFRSGYNIHFKHGDKDQKKAENKMALSEKNRKPSKRTDVDPQIIDNNDTDLDAEQMLSTKKEIEVSPESGVTKETDEKNSNPKEKEWKIETASNEPKDSKSNGKITNPNGTIAFIITLLTTMAIIAAFFIAAVSASEIAFLIMIIAGGFGGGAGMLFSSFSILQIQKYRDKFKAKWLSFVTLLLSCLAIGTAALGLLAYVFAAGASIVLGLEIAMLIGLILGVIAFWVSAIILLVALIREIARAFKK